MKPEMKALSYARLIFVFLNKYQQVWIAQINRNPMGRHLVYSSLLPRREDNIPSWSPCYHCKMFLMESKSQDLAGG